MKAKSRWSVRLGASEWARHTYDRPPDDPLQLLGSARRGLQIGALARLEGEFVLVVGDHVSPLSQADQKALEALASKGKKDERPLFQAPAAPPSVAPPPVVVVIKRRRVPAPH